MSERVTKKKSVLFFANLNSGKKIVVNQGGTSSGKTYSIVDLLFYLAVTEENSVVTVVAQDVPNLKSGAYRDAKRIWRANKEYKNYFYKNDTDRIFTCANGSIIEFKSYQDAEDAKSGKRDYLFINEATGVAYEVFWQLYLRTRKKTFIDYNPSCKFWVHTKVIPLDESELIISDHRHNTFLTKEEHERIERIKDPELWRVYARGLTGKIKELIYSRWDVCNEMPKTHSKHFGGLDFGFTNDPTALVEVMLSNGDLWVDEILYETGLHNDEIAKKIIENKLLNVPISADSAEPKSISEIKRKGCRKVDGVKKGPDSVSGGIQILRGYRIHVTKRSKNIISEFEKYKFAKNRDGEVTNEPIDKDNHAMDALRYAALKFLTKPTKRAIMPSTIKQDH